MTVSQGTGFIRLLCTLQLSVQTRHLTTCRLHGGPVTTGRVHVTLPARLLSFTQITCFSKMDRVCIKDKFGNDRWFIGEDIRLSPLKHQLSLADRLRLINTFDLRPDDVIVAGYLRSGNNWIHQMIYMLLEGTLDPPPLFGPDTNVILETATDFNRVLPPVKPRALFTHLLFKDLPKVVTEKKVKVVHITRNLKDVFVSLYCLLEKYPLRQYYPPWPEFFSTMLDDGVSYGDVFHHVTSWEKAIDDHPEHPFYCVTYEELTQNGVDQLERIDQFLETNRGRPFCQAVVEKCHIDNMVNLRIAKDSKFNWTIFYRKGVVGDWKNWFTVAQNEEFEEVVRKKMAGYKSLLRYQLE